MKKQTNIHEIADKAGVSVATVSRVINQNGRFSSQTENRVRQVITESGYVPNFAAKGLRTSRIQVIGVVVPNILNPYFARLVLELQNILFENKYSTIIYNTNESVGLEKEFVDALQAHQVSGVVFISGYSAPVSLHDVPTIYLDRKPDQIAGNSSDYIIESDNKDGGRLAAIELLSCGCKFPVVIYSSKPDGNRKQRLEGFHQVMAEASINGIQVNEIVLDGTSTASIQSKLTDMSELIRNTDGIFCLTDVIALGTLEILRQMNIKVPNDVCLIGFDDLPFAELIVPPLTTVRQNARIMACLAVRQLLAIISGMQPEPRHNILPVELIRRSTTRTDGQKDY